MATPSTARTAALERDATNTATLDESKLEAFLERLVDDIGTALHGGACWIGDHLGLFKAMADAGPVSSTELAEVTGLNERYLREWLASMAAAEYVTYDPTSARYTLPTEHALPLADETFPFFVGGFVEFVVPWVSVAPKVASAFRSGGGVAQQEYPPETWEAIERASAPFQQQRLVDWLHNVPAVIDRLTTGGSVADVGCGSGRAAIVLAQAFPTARVSGYDVHSASIDRARTNAARSGVSDRVAFEVADGGTLPAAAFDVVTTFDVVHDAADPTGLLQSIRTALKPGGTYLAVEMNAADTVEDNISPLGRLLYSASLLYCMTTSLAQGGAGLGTCMGDSQFRDIAAEAGFKDVETVPIDNPFFILYELHG